MKNWLAEGIASDVNDFRLLTVLFISKNVLVVSFAKHYIQKRFQEKYRIGYILGVSFGATDCIIMDFSSSLVSGFREKKKGMQ